jgi:hypothetical protein
MREWDGKVERQGRCARTRRVAPRAVGSTPDYGTRPGTGHARRAAGPRGRCGCGRPGAGLRHRGLAGVGKTTLAVAAAHAARDQGRYPGGMLFIDLHGYDQAPVEPSQALDASLRALGVPAEHIPPTARGAGWAVPVGAGSGCKSLCRRTSQRLCADIMKHADEVYGSWEPGVTRTGSDYERFVYNKFQQLFSDARVTLNDRIPGRQSDLRREIDISIRITVGDAEILYIVQCKDRGKRPADIQVLGEFSSVIKDVGAAKGFLICTSGFAKTNYRYARTLGIELLTIEDIESDRWHVEIQVPLIYIKKNINYILDATIIPNEELVAKNQTQAIHVDLDINIARISYDLGATSTTISKYLRSWIAKAGSFLGDTVDIDLVQPGFRLRIASTWLACEDLRIKLTSDRKYYLKYLTPTEYSQVRDHLRDTVLPLHLKLSGPGQLDDSFIQIPSADSPVQAPVFVTIEEWTDIERAQGKGRPTATQSFTTVTPAPPFLEPPHRT